MFAYFGRIHHLKNLKDLLNDLHTDARREPSALEGWILEVLFCSLKGGGAFLRCLSTERYITYVGRNLNLFFLKK